MTYKITIKNNGQKRTETVEGIRALNTSLALYRSQGWKITNIKNVRSARLFGVLQLR